MYVIPTFGYFAFNNGYASSEMVSEYLLIMPRTCDCPPLEVAVPLHLKKVVKMMKNFKSMLMLGTMVTLLLSASAVPQLAEAGQADGITQATPQNPPSRQKKDKTSKSKKKGKKSQKGKKKTNKGCCSSSCCKAGTQSKN